MKNEHISSFYSSAFEQMTICTSCGRSIEIVFTTVLFELLNEELFVKDLLEREDYWMVAFTLSFVCFDLGLTLDLA